MAHALTTLRSFALLTLVAAPAAAQAVLFPPFPVGNVVAENINVGSVLGDVNGDGALDIVLRQGLFTSFLHVRLGNGAGGFTQLPPQNVQGHSILHHAVDLDGDGDADLVGHGTNGQGITISLSTGTGSFAPPLHFLPVAPDYKSSVHVVHVDDDGVPDLVVARTGFEDNLVSVHLGVGDGSFVDAGLIETGADSFEPVRAVRFDDRDGDGLRDALVIRDDGTLVVRHALPGGGWADSGPEYALLPPNTPAAALSQGGALLRDLDDDGVPDGLFALGRTLSVRLAQPDGSFGDVITSEAPQPLGPPTLVDLDVDGRADVICPSLSTPALMLMLGDGAGGFAFQGGLNSSAEIDALHAGDVDADGREEIVLRRYESGASRIELIGNATYSDAQPFEDLGQALPGSTGWLTHYAQGTLEPGTGFAFNLVGAAPDVNPILVVGFDALFAPFRGGVLVPAPDRLVMLGPPDVTGIVTLGGSVPDGLSGLVFWTQFVVPDAGAMKGVALSSGVRAEVP